MLPSHIIVADFEYITKNINQPGKDQENIPTMAGLYSDKIAAPLNIEYECFEGDNCMENFCYNLKEISKEIYN